jgi:hypothetical protein
MSQDVARECPLRQALQAAQAVLDGDLGVIQGSMALAGLCRRHRARLAVDADFVVFGAVASANRRPSSRRIASRLEQTSLRSWAVWVLEARVGIEPAYTALQAAA